jgi:hypothetical protein
MSARKATEETQDVQEVETLFDKLRKEVKVPEPLVVTSDIVLKCPTKLQLDLSQIAANEVESNKILLGEENFAKLSELFDNEAPQMWAEFNKAYVAHFFPSQSG